MPPKAKPKSFTVGGAEQESQYKPVAPAPRGCEWKDVVIERQLSVKGGYFKKGLFVDSKEVPREDGEIDLLCPRL